MKLASAIVWCIVKISAEIMTGTQTPPKISSNLEVMNHLNKYSSNTELIKTQNRIPIINVDAFVKPTGSKIDFRSSGFNMNFPSKK